MHITLRFQGNNINKSIPHTTLYTTAGPQSAEHVLQFCPLFRVASKTVLQSSEHILQFCPLFRKARQDHGPQSMYYSSAASSEKQDSTTILRTCSTVLPLLQRSKTGPQSPEHVLQFCPLFREARQYYNPQSMYYSSAPFSEKPDRTTVTRACPTVLPPLQRSQTDHSPQSMFYSSASSSEKQDRSSGPMEQRCKNSCRATRRTF